MAEPMVSDERLQKLAALSDRRAGHSHPRETRALARELLAVRRVVQAAQYLLKAPSAKQLADSARAPLDDALAALDAAVGQGEGEVPGGYNEDTEQVVHGNRIRDHRASGCTSMMGRTSVYVDCPFCGRRVLAYVWSLAGSGKRCPGCPAIHGGRGTTRVKADA